MANASSYPVSFPYGATTSPYTPTNPHKGDDHKCPSGTPIDVGNAIIGLVGSTGKSTGPHVHIQKVAGGVVRNPNGAGLGKTIAFPATVYETGYSASIGNYVRIRDAIGTLWSYFHMLEVKAHNGQVIHEGGEMATREQVNNIYKAVMHREGDPGGLTNYTGKDANQIVAEFLSSQEFKNHEAFVRSAAQQIQALQAALTNEQNEPPEVVVKEVEKIVEKIVEVPVEVIRTVEVEPAWIIKVRDWINNFLRRDK